MRIRVALLSTAACLALASGARAQSVNYGQLEQFFGEPVTTSAIGSPQKAADVPANMEIINSDDIRRSGAVNIPDILRFVSGVDVREYSLGDYDVSVRGYNQPNTPRLLVLVDGRQVYSDDFGYTAWDTIPVQLDEIRQIEVTKGPSSALFGFNAVGGVINIITFDPLSDSVNSVTARGGTNGYAGGDAVGTFHWGDTAGLRLSVGGYRATDADPTNQAKAGAAYYDMSPYARSFSADGRIQVAPGVQATFEGTSSQSQHSSQGVGSGLMSNELFVNNSIKGGLAAESGVGLLNLSVYRNDQHVSDYTATSPIYLDNISYVVQASDLFKLGSDHTIRISAEYRNNQLIAPYVEGAIGYQDYAGSAMWNWQILPSLTLTNSLRLDHLALYRSDAVPAISPYSLSQYQNGSITEPSYNSGLVYKVTDDDTVRLLASQGVQAPSLIDYGLQIPLHSGPYAIGDLAGNPDTHAATVSNYEVDYDRALPGLHSILRSAVYFQKTRDIIAPEFETSPIVIRLSPLPLIYEETQNIGSSSAMGGEIGLKGQLDGLRWNASYSFVKIKDSLSENFSAATPYPVNAKDGTPTSIVIAGFGYSVGDWEADVNGRWQSSYTDYQTNNAGVVVPYVVKNYLTTDVRVGYKINDLLRVAVTAEQLNQANLIQSAGFPVERRVLFSVTATY